MYATNQNQQNLDSFIQKYRNNEIDPNSYINPYLMDQNQIPAKPLPTFLYGQTNGLYLDNMYSSSFSPEYNDNLIRPPCNLRDNANCVVQSVYDKNLSFGCTPAPTTSAPPTPQSEKESCHKNVHYCRPPSKRRKSKSKRPTTMPPSLAPPTTAAPLAPQQPPIMSWTNMQPTIDSFMPPQFQQQYAQPQYAQQQYAQPQYAQPQYAQPQYAQPQYAQPQPEIPFQIGPAAGPGLNGPTQFNQNEQSQKDSKEKMQKVQNKSNDLDYKNSKSDTSRSKDTENIDIVQSKKSSNKNGKKDEKEKDTDIKLKKMQDQLNDLLKKQKLAAATTTINTPGQCILPTTPISASMSSVAPTFIPTSTPTMPLYDGPINDGQTVFCNYSSDNGYFNVYRYVGDNTLRWYNNSLIADSWDPNWRNNAVNLDCTGYAKGLVMDYNGPAYPIAIGELTGFSATGTNVLEMPIPQNAKIGMDLIVGNGEGNTEFHNISEFSDNKIMLDSPLENNYDVGTPIFIYEEGKSPFADIVDTNEYESEEYTIPPEYTTGPSTSTPTPQYTTGPSTSTSTPRSTTMPQYTTGPSTSTTTPRSTTMPQYTTGPSTSTTTPRSTTRPSTSTPTPQYTTGPSTSTTTPRSTTTSQYTTGPSTSTTTPRSTTMPQYTTGPSTNTTTPRSTTRPSTSTPTPQYTTGPSTSTTTPRSTTTSQYTTGPSTSTTTPRSTK